MAVLTARSTASPNAAVELGRAEFLAADVAARRDRKAAERKEAVRNLDAARAEFAAYAAEAYETGHDDAESDSDDLDQIATDIVSFVDSLEPRFDALLIARDAEQGSRRKRTRFDAVRLAQIIARELGEELLGEEAAAVLRRAADLRAA